jgi:hypothetical protein
MIHPVELYIYGIFGLAILAIIHCLLNRRLTTLEKILYMILIIFVPLIGPLLYFFSFLFKVWTAHKKRSLAVKNRLKEAPPLTYQQVQSQFDEPRY